MATPTSPFVSADSLYAGLSVIRFKATNGAVTGATATSSTITSTGHTYAVDDVLTYVSGTGFTGLTAGTHYYVRAIATNTFELAATLGGAAIAVGTSSAGAFILTFIFEAVKLDTKIAKTEYAFERPDSGGISREVRTVVSKKQETFLFATDQAKRLPSLWSGKISGRRVGTCTLYIPDPDDATNIVALRTEEDFACTAITEGDINFGGGQGTLPTILIKSNKAGDITFTRDQSVA